MNTVEPRLWATTDLDYGPYTLHSAAAEVHSAAAKLLVVRQGPLWCTCVAH